VTMTWNRGGLRVANLLKSLLVYQRVPAAEVVVVDTSDDEQIARGVAAMCQAIRGARYVRRRRSSLHKPWALNVGIQAANPFSKVVAVTDIDFMFGPHMVETLLMVIDWQIFVRTVPKRLCADDFELDPFTTENWARLCDTARPWGPSTGPGALQAAERGWWFKVRGYDERFAGGLGGMDTDMLQRALHDHMHVTTVPFDVSGALHQWHPQSPLKGATDHLLDHNAPAVANPEGWGEL